MNVLKPLTVAALVLGLSFAALAADPKRNLAVAKTAAPATEQRVALVIGNSSYKSAPLANPVNDARAIAAKLRTLGFEVIERQNLTQKQVGSVLREFRSKLKPGGVALFFYAGHGLQVKGVNYLPVVDADIASEEDVPTQSLDANKVLELMDEAKTRMNLVFLDACRNNPYARSFRSTADGLAKVNAPSGTILSFATRPGSVAADAGSGRNGLYTEHLLAAMDLPNQPIEQALKRVVSGVKQASKGRQEPWMEGSIEGDFYFKPGQGAQAARLPAAVRVQTPEEVEQELWNAVKTSRDKRDVEDYLKQYPKGRFAPLASQKLKALATVTPAPSKPPVTVASIAPTVATKPEPSPGAVAGKVWKEPTTGMEFVWIPKGCYQMGSPSSESGRSSDEHPHQVCVEGYWLAKYEVTNSQYRQFKPSHDSGNYEGNNLNGDTQPVVSVSWNDATAFAEWLSQKTGKTFKLPTEAEWEYAARAGTNTARYWGDEDSQLCRHANIADRTGKAIASIASYAYDGCDDGYKVSAPVGRFAPNSFGLYDMLGNVWEWTSSPYDQAYAGGEKRAASLSEGGQRVLRGGAWNDGPRGVRAAYRFYATPDDRYNFIGFRLARIP
ncbi:MAG: SUMF1/EgtB/PvdO family nonheme iron enzyme [Gammaproteobacteria bacterium]|nr:SUMF1/EgtB/PvdO family nonheme iron enzyme [Gammaproteobacteria bacterium]